MTKPKTAKLDLGGQKVDVGIPSHLLSDLGGLIYFGALAQIISDKDQAAFPDLWAAKDPKVAAETAASLMAGFGSRLSKKLLAMPERDLNVKVPTGEVLAWVGRHFGIDMEEGNDG